MKIGDTVYTVNNQTHSVDSWTYGGGLPTPKGLLILLESDKKSMFLPKKCVFESKAEAEKVAKL